MSKLHLNCTCPECGHEFTYVDKIIVGGETLNEIPMSREIMCPSCGIEFEYEYSPEEQDLIREEIFDSYADEVRKKLEEDFQVLRDNKLFIPAYFLATKEQDEELVNRLIDQIKNGMLLKDQVDLVKEIKEKIKSLKELGGEVEEEIKDKKEGKRYKRLLKMGF